MKTVMKALFGGLLWVLGCTAAMAFATQEEQINSYLEILAGTNPQAKIQMLERLQWSGLSDPALFDVIETRVLDGYQNDEISTNEFKVLAYDVRALGYSGNEKYLPTLKKVQKEADERKIRGYAKRAVKDMKRFSRLNASIADVTVEAEGKSVEIQAYMKMLKSGYFDAERMATRAVYHERQTDPDLLDLIASNLRKAYLAQGLSGDQQDTAAWYCKALGATGGNYTDLLRQVKDGTQYKKIRKYAAKYVP